MAEYGDAAGLTESLRDAASCLHSGGLVALPTETESGLGADALNDTAANRIYTAKGRPSDNPLIVHISGVEALEELAVPTGTAYQLAQAFWPGPLTMILPKRDIVPCATTGGLDTVALRMPSHPVALELIRQSGVYVAAPSANTSGRPSPTRAEHVVEDMMGRIDYIVDGGAVGIGIESTIVDLSTDQPVILRPGFITRERLEQMIGPVAMDPALEQTTANLRPKAPGMKYTHYAPKGELTLVEAESSVPEQSGMMSPASGQQRVVDRICELAGEKRRSGFRVGIMASAETVSCYQEAADLVVCVGDRQQQSTVAAGLYAALREFDTAQTDYIYAESFQGGELSYAIMNRLLKAAGQRVIYV